MTGPLRLDDLRRRVRENPASLAFAALAEECRRLGLLDEAVALCRAGLDRHPAYHSARVTRARALAALGQFDAAVVDFETVLRAAPENLLARRGLAEVRRAQGDLAGALAHLRVARTLAPADPDLRETTAALEAQATLPALVGARAAASDGSPDPTVGRGRAGRQIAALEAWLAAIAEARAARHGAARA
jgi:tetratricopeptide (TPR) repeat protein